MSSQKYFYFSVLLFIQGICLAQVDPIKVRVFDSSTPEVQSYNTVNQISTKNLITINPYLIGRGAFSIGYERALHKNHSVLIDLGLTYRDFIYEANRASNTNYAPQNNKTGTGTFVQVAYKFYPKGINDFDGGIYVSPSLIHRAYNATDDIQLNNTTVNVDAGYRMIEYGLKFGYCAESWVFEDLIADFYFGIGSRTITQQRAEVTNTNTLNRFETTETKPAIYLGIKLGFVF